MARPRTTAHRAVAGNMPGLPTVVAGAVLASSTRHVGAVAGNVAWLIALVARARPTVLGLRALLSHMACSAALVTSGAITTRRSTSRCAIGCASGSTSGSTRWRLLAIGERTIGIRASCGGVTCTHFQEWERFLGTVVYVAPQSGIWPSNPRSVLTSPSSSNCTYSDCTTQSVSMQTALIQAASSQPAVTRTASVQTAQTQTVQAALAQPAHTQSAQL